LFVVALTRRTVLHRILQRECSAFCSALEMLVGDLGVVALCDAILVA